MTRPGTVIRVLRGPGVRVAGARSGGRALESLVLGVAAGRCPLAGRAARAWYYCHGARHATGIDCAKTYNRLHRGGGRVGLRRHVKAVISSEARVRIPSPARPFFSLGVGPGRPSRPLTRSHVPSRYQFEPRPPHVPFSHSESGPAVPPGHSLGVTFRVDTSRLRLLP